VSEWPTTLVSTEAYSRTAATIRGNSLREAAVKSLEAGSK
jgi:hypothetical protein